MVTITADSGAVASTTFWFHKSGKLRMIHVRRL